MGYNRTNQKLKNHRNSRAKALLKKDSKNPKALALDVLIVIMVFIILVQILHFADECKYAFEQYTPSKNTYRYEYQDDDFQRLARHVQDYPQAAKKKELKEYVAVGNYYNDSMLYYSYLKLGDQEKADQKLLEMNEDVDQMGSLGKAKEKIDDFLKR